MVPTRHFMFLVFEIVVLSHGFYSGFMSMLISNNSPSEEHFLIRFVMHLFAVILLMNTFIDFGGLTLQIYITECAQGIICLVSC